MANISQIKLPNGDTHNFIDTASGYTKNAGTITSVKTTAGTHTTIDISSGAANFNVPTKTSHLTNDSGFVTTDEKVKQSATTTTSWRKVLLHYSTNDKGDAVPTATNQVYAAIGVEVNPSTGTLAVASLNSSGLIGGGSLNITGPATFGDTVSIDDLNAGQLVVSGSASFANNLQANTINGVTVGNSPKFTDTVTTVTTTGSGNAVTAITASNGVLTVTKGATYSNNAGTITSVKTTAGAHTAINTTSGAVTFNVPTTAAHVGIKFDYTTSGNNRAVEQDSNGNLYVTQKDSNTTYSAGDGLSLSSTTFSLATSGATAGSYGPSANASPSHGGTFSVPYVTVDIYGRVTAVSTKTITLPADSNTDSKVKITAVTPASQTTNYVLTHTATSGTTEVDAHAYNRYWYKQGSTSVNGYVIAGLGNDIATGTANNSQGYMRLYGPNTGYSTLTYANSTSNVTNTLPATTGTLLNTAGGQQINNITTLYREGTTANNYPAGLKFKVKDTTTGQTYDSGYLYAYQDHGSTTYGVNFVLNGGGGLFIGSGESPGAHYSAKGSTYSGEDTFITADGTVFIQGNGNTIANRLGFYVNTSHQIIPCKADAATNNVGSLGTSDYKWANLYVTNINGVAVGSSPKFTDSGGTVTSITLTQGAGISIGSSGTAITTSGTRTIALATSGVTAGTYGAQNNSSFILSNNVVPILGVKVDTYGRVTATYVKQLYCYQGDIICANAASGTSTSISKGTITQIPLTNTLVSSLDRDNLALASNRITISDPGIYRITGSVYITTTAAASVGVYIMKGSGAFSNATEIASSYIYESIAGSYSINVTKTIEKTGTTAEYVYLAGRSSNGGTVASSNVATYLEVQEIII